MCTNIYQVYWEFRVSWDGTMINLLKITQKLTVFILFHLAKWRNILFSCKKSLRIPKGQLEVVNRRTDNAPAKRKKTLGKIIIYKTLHRKPTAPHVAPVVLLLLQTRWLVMNEERIMLWLRQAEHIRDNLWHRYSVMANKVMVATVKLPNWWLRST
jgi:hypothetical protein